MESITPVSKIITDISFPQLAAICFTKDRVRFSQKLTRQLLLGPDDKIVFKLDTDRLYFHRGTDGFRICMTSRGNGASDSLINSAPLIRLLLEKFKFLHLKQYPVKEMLARINDAPMYEILIHNNSIKSKKRK